MRRPLVFLLDAAIVAAAAAAAAIFVTGGLVFEWHGHLVRAQRAQNPLWAFFGLALLRLAANGGMPFLAVWPVDGWTAATTRAIERLADRLRALQSADARRFVFAVILVSAAAKLWNVVFHYGFTYGDDVEVHLLTFSKLGGHDLGVWDLRSPVYPLVFIYPVQALLSRVGVQDPTLLIAAGRLVVVAFSMGNVWLAYRLGVALFGSQAVGVVAAFLLGTMRLHVRLGSSEEPRTVSTTFLLLALWWLSGPRGAARAALAGFALGIAAALRFSEVIFAIPVGLQLVLERRGRDITIAGAACVAAMALILGPGDRLFWPEMFHSLRNVVEFTLVRGESSRGFEPLTHYVRTAPWWTNPFALLLVFVGLRAAPATLRLWAFAPIVALSLFPHKEERYLIPVLPFLMLIAARGAWELLERARADRMRPALVALILAGATLLEVEGFRFRRSESAIDVARFLAGRDARAVAMEDGTTTSGATLYLRPRATVVNLEPQRLAVASYLWGVLEQPHTQYVVLRGRSLRPTHLSLFAEAGFAEVAGPNPRRGDRYRIFQRGTPTLY
jgi:hypothetical protein